MSTRHRGRFFAVSLFPLFLMIVLLSGCGGDSRTSGTQVTFSPEAKAQIADMKDMYKNLKKGGAKTSSKSKTKSKAKAKG